MTLSAEEITRKLQLALEREDRVLAIWTKLGCTIGHARLIDQENMEKKNNGA